MKITLMITTIMMVKKPAKLAKIVLAIAIWTISCQFPLPSMMKTSSWAIMDGLSFWMIQLTLWVIMITMYTKTNSFSKMVKMMAVMSLILIVTFTTWSFMTFYITFEASMIVVLMIMVSWGYQPERVEAIMYMVMMTIMTSLPFMISLMMNMYSINFWNCSLKISLTDYASFMLVLMMKMPVFFLHMWLPKVHVESPVQGSMILASILLKLGTYGMMRTITMMSKTTASIKFLIAGSMIWAAALMSMTCIMQTDVKVIIAYSSIVHMTTAFLGIVMNKSASMAGTLMILLGHGMCSSGMFFMANKMYKISKSRSVIMNKGLLASMPMTSMMWFMMCMGNAPMPPSINVLGEFLTFKTLISWSSNAWPGVATVMIISSFYSIWIFYCACHGQSTKMAQKMSTQTKTLIVSFMHLAPLLMMTLKPQMIMT